MDARSESIARRFELPMLVGRHAPRIGFGSILIGAVPERSVARDLEAETDEVDATEEELLRELRDLSARLLRIEAAVSWRTSDLG